MKKMIKRHCEKHHGPLKDIEAHMGIHTPVRKNSYDSRKKKINRENDFIFRDLITALTICHNVTPTMDEGVKVYQAASPDEVSLVKFAETLKMTLLARDQNFIRIQNAAGQEEEYDILANFPFSSETKRMGILVKHRSTGRIIFYLKGADMVMISKVKQVYKTYVIDECENLAREGLRTLVIAQKMLLPEEYEDWKKIYDEANLRLYERHQAIRNAAELLEKDLEFLGVTGVEDKLQDNVCNTIESMRYAGIKIWMLTGDKVETAKCIAISAGIKSLEQDIYEIKDNDDEIEIHQQMLDYSKKHNSVLLIEGGALTKMLDKHEKLFFDIATEAPAVICCRCLPKQKATITEGIKIYAKKRVCCVGDGGNDVGMIQAADVGIGIVGKEGMQAALASDFSIQEFKYLSELILWHGRNSYKRSSTLSHFIIHRGTIISMIQMFFTIIFHFVAIPVYNGVLMLGFSTFYTNLPILCLITDEDVSRKKAIEFPPLYATLQKDRELSTKNFIVWIWISTYQGLVIMLMGSLLFDKLFLEVITITFTALIAIELLNVYSLLHIVHRIMIISQCLTFAAYLISILFLREYIDTAIIDGMFFLKVLSIVAVSWLPVHCVKMLLLCCDPSEEEKLMMKV